MEEGLSEQIRKNFMEKILETSKPGDDLTKVKLSVANVKSALYETLKEIDKEDAAYDYDQMLDDIEERYEY